MPLTLRAAAWLAAGTLLLSAPRVQAAPDGKAVMTKNNCFACHAIAKGEAKKLGPNFADVAAKYAADKAAPAKLKAKITKGGAGVWGAVPMPPQAQLKPDELTAAVTWILAQKPKK